MVLLVFLILHFDRIRFSDFNIMKLLTLCTAIHLLVMTAYAAVIPPQASTEFAWDDSSSKTFAIDLSWDSRIHVTDLDAASKGLRVYDNGVLLGETTSKSTVDPLSLMDSKHPNLQGYFDLAKGHHVIKLQLKEPAKEKGSGMIQVLPESKRTHYTFLLSIAKFCFCRTREEELRPQERLDFTTIRSKAFHSLP